MSNALTRNRFPSYATKLPRSQGQNYDYYMPFYVTRGDLPRNASMRDVSRRPPQPTTINGYTNLIPAKDDSRQEEAISAIRNRAKRMLRDNEQLNGLYDSTLEREQINAARIKRVAKAMVQRIRGGADIIDTASTAAQGNSGG